MPNKKKKVDKTIKKRKSENVKKPYLERKAKLYAFWKSMPVALHSIYYKPTGMTKIGEMGFDIDDEVFIKLISIRSRTEFGKTFGVSLRQLERWDGSEIVQKWTEEFNKQSNVLRFKKDVDFHFTRKVVTEADAPRVKLWKQLYEGWQEKQKVEYEGKVIILDDEK